jgi:hypothetical protein
MLRVTESAWHQGRGGGLGTVAYTLTMTCSNVSDTVPASAVLVPGGPFNGNHNFGTAPWVLSAPGLWTFDQHVSSWSDG